MKEKVRLLLEKIKLHRIKVGISVLGFLVLTGAVFGVIYFLILSEAKNKVLGKA